jgi:hypothetical protein
MLRKAFVCVAALAVLAGCGPYGPSNYGGYNAAPMLMERAANGQFFAYSHVLSLVMSHDSVKARFDKARDKCLKDAALKCTLIGASISDEAVPSYGTGGALARLVVALPHDQVAAFEEALMQALPQDGSQKLVVASHSTSAENVSNAVSDTDRKIVQLTTYRDRLAALAKRSDLGVADLMKIEAELSKVQGDLDAALAEKRDLAERAGKEQLTVSLQETQDRTAPLARVWRNAGDTLIDSSADALGFLIRALPWLPVVGAGVLFVSWLWRLRRRKKEKAAG